MTTFFSSMKSTLPTVIVGGGYNKQGGLENFAKVGNWGVVINGGRWKNREKWSKFGQKLHEFERFRTIFCILEKYFSKIVNWGGRNKLKCLEKNPNFGNYPPPPQLRGGEGLCRVTFQDHKVGGAKTFFREKNDGA